jgi:hypothetical protein
MGGHEEGDEEGRVGEGSGRDDVLAGDVDGGEPGRGQEPDQDEVDELAVAESQCRSR